MALIPARGGDVNTAIAQGNRCPDRAWIPGVVQELYAHGELERASDMASELDHPWLEELPWNAGDSLYVRTRFGPEVHLAAGRYEKAAAAARAGAAALADSRRGTKGLRVERARELECIADAIEASHGGEASAAEALRSRVTADDDSFCALLLADLLEGDERAAVLRSRPKLVAKHRSASELLLAEAGLADLESATVPHDELIPYRLHGSPISAPSKATRTGWIEGGGETTVDSRQSTVESTTWQTRRLVTRRSTRPSCTPPSRRNRCRPFTALVAGMRARLEVIRQRAGPHKRGCPRSPLPRASPTGPPPPLFCAAFVFSEPPIASPW